MKIELIESNGLSNGIKDISQRFGPSALILRNVKSSEQEFLFVAHDNTVTSQKIKSSDLGSRAPSDEASKASRQDIEIVKSALKELPKVINSAGSDSKYSRKEISQPKPGKTGNVVKEHFINLMKAAPISDHIRGLLCHVVNEPNNQAELLSQLKSGMMEYLPNPTDITLNTKIHVLTGGHGVGKTSIALKITSQLCSASERKVSIVSLGADCSADLAQLKASGKSLGVSVINVNNISELSKLLYLKNPEDIYIIDLDIDSAKEAIPLIRETNSDSQIHLVVPSDASLESFWRICELDNWESIILTRLDLPLVPWAALEAMSRFKIPLSIGSANREFNSGLVKVTNSNVIRSLEEYLVQHMDTNKGEPIRAFNVSALH